MRPDFTLTVISRYGDHQLANGDLVTGAAVQRGIRQSMNTDRISDRHKHHRERGLTDCVTSLTTPTARRS